ncbi:MAG: L-threonylcarbamoyladenylate synthase, partial [Candidatus Krumholzibacteriia bacterium]
MTRRLAQAADAARLLADGGVLLLATDTLPGLHARVDRPAAVRKVAALKGRPGDKPLLVVAASLAAARTVLGPLDARQLAYAGQCWPGPFSLVLPAAPQLAPEVTGGGATVAVRVPAPVWLRDLLGLVPCPLVSTSANRSGEAPAVTLAEAAARFGPLVDGVYGPPDGEPSAGAASALVDLTGWPPRTAP